MRRLGPALSSLVLVALACTPIRTAERHPTPTPIKRTPDAVGARVPRTFAPVSYAAQLAVGEGGVLTGTIDITGDLATPSDVIWLHGAELQIDSAIARSATSTVPLDAGIVGPGYVIALDAPAPLAAGRWVITIAYRATIDDKGPIPDDHEGREHLRIRGRAAGVFREWVDGLPYVFTMSEPMDARRIFPCVDEPDRKVPWQLTLDVREDHVAASNTPIVRETLHPGGRKRVEFAPTLPLPSYLIAFAVGPFDVVDAGVSTSGIPIRILMQKGESVLASWAATATAPIVDAVEAWFGIPLAYRKLDLVAVPVTGPRWVAMENPGLVTFLSSTLRDTTDAAHGDEWRYVVVHELAHQWFGNLVTPAWWDDIWLNESFAVWLTSKLTVQLSPNADPSYGTSRVGELTSDTSGVNGPTVRIPASALDDPRQMARYFSGHRGAHVLAMLEAFVSPAVFQSAVQSYLRAHAHRSATAADFIAALDAASGKSMAPIVTGYLDQPGAPGIAVALHCERDRTKLDITLEGANWSVPVCVAYDRDGARADQCLVVDQPKVEVVLPTGTCPRWVLPNAGGRGLYATRWVPGTVDDLLEVGWAQLTPLERTEVLHEITPTLDPSRTIAVVSALLAAANPDPVALAWGARMLRPYVRMAPDQSRFALIRWITSRYAVAARLTGFAADPAAGPDAEQRRADALALLAAVRDRELGRIALTHLQSRETIPLAFRGPLYELAFVVDATLAARTLKSLSGMTDQDRRWELMASLSRVENISTIVRRDSEAFSALAAVEQRKILGAACTLVDRDARIAIINEFVAPRDRVRMADEVTVDSDRCIAERASLEPAFRAWLGPKRR